MDAEGREGASGLAGRLPGISDGMETLGTNVSKGVEAWAELLAGYWWLYAGAVTLALIVIPVLRVVLGSAPYPWERAGINFLIGLFTLGLVGVTALYWSRLRAVFGDDADAPERWISGVVDRLASDEQSGDGDTARTALRGFVILGPALAVVYYLTQVTWPYLRRDLLECPTPPCLGSPSASVSWLEWTSLGLLNGALWVALILVGFTFLTYYAYRWLEVGDRIAAIEPPDIPDSTDEDDWTEWWAARRVLGLAVRRLNETWLLGWSVVTLVLAVAGLGRLGHTALTPGTPTPYLWLLAGTFLAWLAMVAVLIALLYGVWDLQGRLRAQVQEVRERGLDLTGDGGGIRVSNADGNEWTERPPATELIPWSVAEILTTAAFALLSILSSVLWDFATTGTVPGL